VPQAAVTEEKSPFVLAPTRDEAANGTPSFSGHCARGRADSLR